jgi:hypothetical protein
LDRCIIERATIVNFRINVGLEADATAGQCNHDQ